jgi:hypothetical protein
MNVEVSAGLIVSLLAAVVALLVFLDRKYGEGSKQRERIAVIEKQLEIIWAVWRDHFPTLLKAPTHQEMDWLLDKLHADPPTLTQEETVRLEMLLEMERLKGHYHAPDALPPHKLLMIPGNMALLLWTRYQLEHPNQPPWWQRSWELCQSHLIRLWSLLLSWVR